MPHASHQAAAQSHGRLNTCEAAALEGGQRKTSEERAIGSKFLELSSLATGSEVVGKHMPLLNNAVADLAVKVTTALFIL